MFPWRFDFVRSVCNIDEPKWRALDSHLFSAFIFQQHINKWFCGMHIIVKCSKKCIQFTIVMAMHGEHSLHTRHYTQPFLPHFLFVDPCVDFHFIFFFCFFFQFSRFFMFNVLHVHLTWMTKQHWKFCKLTYTQKP